MVSWGAVAASRISSILVRALRARLQLIVSYLYELWISANHNDLFLWLLHIVPVDMQSIYRCDNLWPFHMLNLIVLVQYVLVQYCVLTSAIRTSTCASVHVDSCVCARRQCTSH